MKRLFPPRVVSVPPVWDPAYQPTLAEPLPVEPGREELARWYHLDLASGADPADVATALAADPAVEWAEPNWEWRLADQIPIPITGIPDGTTDPGYESQWYLQGASVERAWVYLKNDGVYPGGLHDTVVAVIDTGVDYNHEDLVGNM